MAIFNLFPGTDNKYADLNKQIITYLPVNTSFVAANIVGFINKAITQNLYPVIGREQYRKFDTDTANYPDDLIDLLRRCVFNLAFASYASIGNVQIMATGLMEAEVGNQKPARLESIAKFQNEVAQIGMQALDEILFFIESQLTIPAEVSKYTDFVNANAEQAYAHLFIKTASEFDKHFPINQSRIVFSALRENINFVQTLLVKPLLHKELYDLVASDDTENIKLLKSLFIKNAIAHLSIARSVYKLTAIIGQNNTIAIFDNTANNYGKTHKTAPIELLEKFKDEAEKQGQFYLSEMVAYIKANPQDYPTYPHALPIDFTEDDDHLTHNHPRIVVF